MSNWHNKGDADSRLGRAIEVACEVAAQQGVRCDRPIVLQNLSNVVLGLAPAAIVARVSTTTESVRPGEAWFQRELAIAQHLADRGAPIIPPSTQIDPGPHSQRGLTVSFWQWVEVLAQPIDAVAAGKALQICHTALADFAGTLPVLGLLAEAPELLAQIPTNDGFTDRDRVWLQRICQHCYDTLLMYPSQPLHGDPHLGNVLMTREGLVWTDWEDAFFGPIEWDLASLVASAVVLGEDCDRAEAALRGYGTHYNPEILDRCIEARTLVTLIWNLIFDRQHPSQRHRDRARDRLNWLKQRF